MYRIYFFCLLSSSASLLHILIFISGFYAGNHHDDVSPLQMTATSNYKFAIHTHTHKHKYIYIKCATVIVFSLLYSRLFHFPLYWCGWKMMYFHDAFQIRSWTIQPIEKYLRLTYIYLDKMFEWFLTVAIATSFECFLFFSRLVPLS